MHVKVYFRVGAIRLRNQPHLKQIGSLGIRKFGKMKSNFDLLYYVPGYGLAPIISAFSAKLAAKFCSAK
jgi:hypothetical protein